MRAADQLRQYLREFDMAYIGPLELIDALERAAETLEEVYCHHDAKGEPISGPEAKVIVKRSTLDKMGDVLVAVR